MKAILRYLRTIDVRLPIVITKAALGKARLGDGVRCVDEIPYPAPAWEQRAKTLIIGKQDIPNLVHALRTGIKVDSLPDVYFLGCRLSDFKAFDYFPEYIPYGTGEFHFLPAARVVLKAEDKDDEDDDEEKDMMPEKKRAKVEPVEPEPDLFSEYITIEIDEQEEGHAVVFLSSSQDEEHRVAVALLPEQALESIVGTEVAVERMLEDIAEQLRNALCALIPLRRNGRKLHEDDE